MSTRLKQKSTARAVLFCLERCLPLRASDAAFGNDVHCVSDVSPCGEVANITSLCDEGAIHHYGEAITSLRRSRYIALYKRPKVCYNKIRKVVVL